MSHRASLSNGGPKRTPMANTNPYLPPVESQPGESMLPLLPEAAWTQLDIRVDHVDRGWWTRRLRLAGDVQAELFYDPSGHGERVYVNRQLLVTTPFLHFSGNVVPEVDFFMEARGYRVPAKLLVTVSLLRLLKLTRFELQIAGHIVYRE